MSVFLCSTPPSSCRQNWLRNPDFDWIRANAVDLLLLHFAFALNRRPKMMQILSLNGIKRRGCESAVVFPFCAARRIQYVPQDCVRSCLS